MKELERLQELDKKLDEVIGKLKGLIDEDADGLLSGILEQNNAKVEIDCKKGYVKAEGTTPSLLTALAMLIDSLLKHGISKKDIEYAINVSKLKED